MHSLKIPWSNLNLRPRLNQLVLPSRKKAQILLLKTPKCPHNYKLVCANPNHLLPPSTNAFTKLHMDLLMMQCFHWINEYKNKNFNNNVEWHALEIKKYFNVSYCHTIIAQGFPMLSFKQHLQFEITCLKKFLVDDFDIY